MRSSPQPSKSVLLVTSDELGWDAVRHAAQELLGRDAVIEAQSGSQAIRLASEHRPGLVLLSCALDEGNVPALIRALQELLPDSVIIAIGAWTSAMETAVMAQAPATGRILWEDLTMTALQHLLLVALTGRFTISSRSTGLAVHEATRDEGRSFKALGQLTEREITVLQELGNGLTARQIAVKHGYSLRTIRRLITSLEHKLSAHTSFMLGVRASQLGITS